MAAQFCIPNEPLGADLARRAGRFKTDEASADFARVLADLN
jgi:hypothetical protein